MAKKQLDKKIATAVVNYCNKDIVPDGEFNSDIQYESEWFEEYFSFLNDEKLQKHVGSAYYQARFMYKLMSALRLPKAKHQGIVKFQIIQYASIYEAILDNLIEKNFKNEIMTKYGNMIYAPVSALSKDAKLTYANSTVYICKQKLQKKSIKSMNIEERTEFAVEKGMITVDVARRICGLYDLRNNVHILKATRSDYVPQINQAKDAFQLMQEFVEQIKVYMQNVQTNSCNEE